MSAIVCVNTVCEWHRDGGCALFPGGFGVLSCKHYNDHGEVRVQVRAVPKKSVKKQNGNQNRNPQKRG